MATEAERLIIEVLRAAGKVLDIGEIRKSLREKGRSFTEEFLDRACRSSRSIVSAGPRQFGLPSHLPEGGATSVDSDELPARPSTLIHLQELAKGNYVAFDLETTGRDLQEDRLIQIGAVKVRDGQVAGVFFEFASPADRSLGLPLRRLLDIPEGGTLDRLLTTADSQESVVSRFAAFVGGDLLVAHNAVDFDWPRLVAAGMPDTHRVLDTLELAFLACPGATHHNLAQVAERAGIRADDARVRAVVSREPRLQAAGFHNALFDAAVLHLVAEHLCAALVRPNGRGIYELLAAVLLPEFIQSSCSPDEIVAGLTGALSPAGFPDQTRLEGIAVEANQPASAEFRSYLERTGREPREPQVQMVGIVSDTLEKGGVSVVEAPTGTGKSLGLAFPAARYAVAHGQPILISTRTKNLQDQLEHDLSDLADHGTVSFRYSVLKGRGNYLCATALEDLLRQALEDPPAAPIYERLGLVLLAGWALEQSASGADGDLESLSFAMRQRVPVLPRLIDQVRAERGRCRDEACRKHRGCYRAQARARAKAAHIVVCNHSLWLSPGWSDFPEPAGVLLDEAHELEDAATSAWTEEVTDTGTYRLLSEILSPGDRLGLVPRILRHAQKDGGAAVSARHCFGPVRMARAQVMAFGAELVEFLRRVGLNPGDQYGAVLRFRAEGRREYPTRWLQLMRAGEVFRGSLGDVATALGKLAGACEADAECEKFQLEAAFLAEQMQTLSDTLKACLSHSEPSWVAWSETQAAGSAADTRVLRWAVRRAPVSVADRLRERFAETRSLVLTSATMAIRGRDFSFLLDRLGLSQLIDNKSLHQLPPAFDYRNALLLIPRYLDHVPQASSMQFFIEELGAELETLFTFTGGRGLVLFAARSRMEAVFQRIEPPLGREGVAVLAQTASGGSREVLRRAFAADEHSVLLGLKSFWQGVDVPGPACSIVVIEKLPFPSFGDPIIDARREAIAAKGGAEFDDYLLPLALLGFKQGFGRLLRTTTDRGVVLLMDRRVHSRAYKKDLLDTLPGYRRLPEVESSRRETYRAIAEHIPNIFDTVDVEHAIEAIPEQWLSGAELALQRLRVPNKTEPNQYSEIRPVLIEALRRVFGHDGFRSSEQEAIIRAVLEGRDVLGLLPTGGGKSLTFQLPALLRDGLTLVVSPLIALMRDQVEKMHALRLDTVAALTSHMSGGERDEVLRRVRSGAVRLLYVSPERLRDAQLAAAVRVADVVQVVVDEAHCISMWGPSFRPEYVGIASALRRLDLRPPILALTATATTDVTGDIVRRLELQDPVMVRGDFDRPELTYVVYDRRSPVYSVHSQNDKFRYLLAIVRAADRRNEMVVVYTSTIRRAEELARKLAALGFPTRAYHGQMPADERSEVQDLFLDDHLRAVVATKAFGMGIDKPDIRYLVHYDVPGDLESYIQETGRAGRDGQPAYPVLLYHPGDVKIQEFFIDNGTLSTKILESLAAAVRREMADGAPIQPTRLAMELDTEEDDVRIGLFWLEECGWIVRETDLTESAFVTLVEDVTAPGSLDLSEVDRAVLTELLSSGRLPAFRRVNIDLGETAAALSTQPETLERLFVVLASAGIATFRPMARCSRYRPGSAYSDHIQAARINETFAARRRDKLHVMVSYASSRRQCRRQVLLGYLGQSEVSDRCSNCDVCRVPPRLPWSGERLADLPNPSQLFEPHTVALQLIEANVARAQDERRNPLGRHTLKCVLSGNAYSVVSRERDPWLRKWKDQRLRAFPQWGLLSSLPRREFAIDRVFETLIARGLVSQAQSPLEDGAAYGWLQLTERGRDAVTRGLQWDAPLEGQD